MSTDGETADLVVREGIQITESAVKLAGLGAKNLAAFSSPWPTTARRSPAKLISSA